MGSLKPRTDLVNGNFRIVTVDPEFKGEIKILLETVDHKALFSKLETVFGPHGRNHKYQWRVHWGAGPHWGRIYISVRGEKLLTHLSLMSS
jgi:hypothetical protein